MPQAIDQVLQINAPGPRAMAAIAIGTGKLADPVAAQIDDQPVTVRLHHDLTANQARRHRIEHLPHLDRADSPSPWKGVYEGERQWGQIAILTFINLKAIALSAENLRLFCSIK